MIFVLSPAKTLDFSPSPLSSHTLPSHLEQTWQLVRKMRKFSAKGIGGLMGVSDAIAELNRGRFQDFATPVEPDGTTKQAVLAFKGDTYKDMGLEDWAEADHAYAQEHVRILSGLYGVLRPLDLIKPYRLEMGTSLKTRKGKNLYEFWGAELATAIAEDMAEHDQKAVVKLASNEYFKAISKHLPAGVPVVEVDFLDFKNGKYKTISFFAKRARGAMAAWAVRQRVERVEGLKSFDVGGYAFDDDDSTSDHLVFRRDNSA